MSKRIRWNKELIVEKIREHHSQGIILRGYIIKDVDMPLYRASIRYFGGWGKAVKSSGFDYKISTPNRISIIGDTKNIIVTRRDGSEFIVHVDRDINLPNSVYISSGYPRIYIDGKEVYLHKYVYGEISKGNEIDHLDRDPLNCRMSNLREVTPTQNQYNKIVKGYYRDGRKWRARISIDGLEVNLGSFDTEIEASTAYKQACIKHRGKYAPEEYNIIN
ncbi:HNH endonuclease [Bacillus toyonensis]|uniref:HNH endonuclease n=1 Tax=Bacillus toyonensis TaxID=155322 RepID=UPI000BF3E610|nr:HNH endonuclease [Bacillus toyonensis]PGF00885.1 hypothetical protein COM61_22790 [Bacillus toyonensis]PHE46977.1 hypothetical protein COF71_13540 [Bacillus toyonensis]